MPHAILDYSANLAPHIAQKTLLIQIHRFVLDCGLFNPADVKSRAFMATEYLVGEKGTDGHYAHLRVYILEGRTPEQKLSLSQPLFDLLRAALPADTSVTVDIRDLDKASYKKVVAAA